MAEKTKVGLFTRIKNFFKGFVAELKKVTWYSREQTLKSTLVVCITVVVVAIVVGLVDLGFASLIQFLGNLI